MHGSWDAPCLLIRFARVIACIAAVVVVHAAEAEVATNSGPEHSASTCESDDFHSHEPDALRGEDNTIGARTDLHDHGTRGNGDEPEDPALSLVDYYKRLDRPHLALADWQKVGAQDSSMARATEEIRTGSTCRSFLAFSFIF